MTTHEPPPHVATQEHEHPGEAVYVRVAIFLAVLTGIEVALSYLKIGGSQILTNGSLLVLAAIKFATVAMYFMHLKFDHPVLRRLFVAGLVLAVIVYMLYLLTLHTFIGS
ncbi:MAG TPA: cytochrome C oxidase subunit IV family protein [Acidimicrobiales bacterium]|jgi:cytochrome c oxidase subunit IV|nr:cytochrome C oxidase subunit IV family protein [Acidimicrobiales bacterium]